VSASLVPLKQPGFATLERGNVGRYRHREHHRRALLRVIERIDPRTLIPKLEGAKLEMNRDGILLRALIGESDRLDGRPLYEAIVQLAREMGLAGATVLRGVEGFGANSVIHKSMFLEMSDDLPIVVEIVDEKGKIEGFLPRIDKIVIEGMITMEYVSIVKYVANPQKTACT
jgi:PII-like signaling protein